MADCLEKKLESLEVMTSISRRGALAASSEDFLSEYFAVASSNPYHAEHNQKGIINLGTAVSRLMEPELEQRLRAEDSFKFSASDHQHYYDYTGTPKCKAALSNFLERHFSKGRPVPPEQLVVLNGVTSCLDTIAYCTCDAGDVMITPTPVYGRIFTDFLDRSRVDVQPLYLLPKEGSGPGKDFELRPQCLEERIQELTAAGKTVRAFVLVNPQNPLGDIYPTDLVMALLKVCAKYEIHAIIDEIYGLSLLEGAQFGSVLSMDHLPDPQRTHFLWGMSKDFGLAGLRVGVIHTRNPHILRCLGGVLIQYQNTPSIIHDLVASMLQDTKWCDEYFLPCSQRRLTASHKAAKQQLEAAGVHVHPSEAGLFAWVNIAPFMRELTVKAELALFRELLSCGLFAVPGTELHCASPGWFRLVVSVSEEELSEGISRFVSVIHSRRAKQGPEPADQADLTGTDAEE